VAIAFPEISLVEIERRKSDTQWLSLVPKITISLRELPDFKQNRFSEYEFELK
jgi:hypothetical protein